MVTDVELAVLAYRSYVPSFANDVQLANWARDAYSAQVAEAIKLVADARNAYPNATITRTGYSLGGGGGR